MSFNTPILFIIFNRLDTTKEVFSKIRAIKPKQLFISADGPRIDRIGENELCDSVKEYVESNIDWECSVYRKYNSRNVGCKIAVSSAIDWIFSMVDNAIILEDDCVPEESFFDFSEQMLARYKNENQVMMISGTNYLMEVNEYKYDYFFSNYFAIWGWATWKRAWEKYDIKMKSWPQYRIENKLMEYIQDKKITEQYKKIFDQAYRNEIDTWDIQWFYSCLFCNGVTIVPVKNQVSNIGILGTHTDNEISKFNYMRTIALENKYYTGSSEISVDQEINNEILSVIFNVNNCIDIKINDSKLSSYILDKFKKIIQLFKNSGLNGLVILLRKILSKVKRMILKGNKKNGYPVYIMHHNNRTVLFSYLADSIVEGNKSKKLNGHSNKWESREIARIFLRKGFSIVGINWDDYKYLPIRSDFDIIFDIHKNLSRLYRTQPKALKLLHLTGSNPEYSNRREVERINQMLSRKGGEYSPKRQATEDDMLLSLDVADYCSLIGTERTLHTYPEKYWEKITLVPVSGSKLARIKKENELLSNRKEFLWFFGAGAVHKGLDLLLELFSRRDDLSLNIIGNIEGEKDFFSIYSDELYNKPNIHYWGMQDPSSDIFGKVAKKCNYFIAPSCSEGISPAAVTCMQVGLFPIVSIDTGVYDRNIPGICFEELTVESIEKSIEIALTKSNEQLKEELVITQKEALRKYSRRNFSFELKRYLESILGNAI